MIKTSNTLLNFLERNHDNREVGIGVTYYEFDNRVVTLHGRYDDDDFFMDNEDTLFVTKEFFRKVKKKTIR